MTFIGRLKQHSAIWQRWRGEARTGGMIYGVHFAWEPGNVYRTLPLTPHQIAFLQAHDNIALEIVGTDLPPPVTVVAKDDNVVAERPSGKPAIVNHKPIGRMPGR